MNVHREKISEDKQILLKRCLLNCFGRDLRRLQLMFQSDADKSC